MTFYICKKTSILQNCWVVPCLKMYLNHLHNLELVRASKTERHPPKIYSRYTFSVCILCSFLSHEICLETLALGQGVPAILTEVLGSLACVGGLMWRCHANLCRYAWEFYYSQIINAISIRNIWQWITFLKFLETYNWRKKPCWFFSNTEIIAA